MLVKSCSKQILYAVCGPVASGRVVGDAERNTICVDGETWRAESWALAPPFHYNALSGNNPTKFIQPVSWEILRVIWDIYFKY